MPENRNWIFLGLYDHTNQNNVYLDTSRGERKIVRYRNQISDILNPGGVNTHVVVSGVFRSTRVAPNHDYEVLGFLIEHRDGLGNPTGPQWLLTFCVSATTGATSAALSNFMNAADTFYASNVSNGAYSNPSGAVHPGHFHYNPIGGLGGVGNVYNMAFDNPATLSYNESVIYVDEAASPYAPGAILEIPLAGGGTATATYQAFDKIGSYQARIYVTNPSATGYLKGGTIVDQATGLLTMKMATTVRSITPIEFHGQLADIVRLGSSGIYPTASFMPSAVMPKGIACTVMTVPGYWGILFDWTNATLCVYQVDFYTFIVPQITGAILMGEALTPSIGGGGNKTFVSSMRLSNAGVFSQQLHQAIYDQWSPGAVGIFALNSHAQYTRTNSPNPSEGPLAGTFPSDPIIIDNTNEEKGIINTSIARTFGASANHHQRMISTPDGPLVKIHTTIGLPWQTAVPIFPPVPWGAGNNTDPGGILDDGDI